MTHRNVTAIDEYLEYRVVLIGVQGVQVVEGGMNRPVSPLCELTRQVFGLLVVELTMQNMLKHLQDEQQSLNEKLPYSCTRSTNDLGE